MERMQNGLEQIERAASEGAEGGGGGTGTIIKSPQSSLEVLMALVL